VHRSFSFLDFRGHFRATPLTFVVVSGITGHGVQREYTANPGRVNRWDIMRYWRSVKPLVMVVAGLLSPGVDEIAAAAESPVDVGSKSQLFVDRVLVRRADGVWFTQHEGEKHPLNPLLKADEPWEGW
jgi:hypothetical protein